jgi:quercetin dioxygenase-like cupin family protein
MGCHGAACIASPRTCRRLGVAFATFIALLAAASAAAQDVMLVGADTHTVLLENAQVRVLAVRVRPGEKVPLHWHPANVTYFLGDATLRITSADGTSVVRDIKAGVASWNEPVTHAVENVGAKDFTEVQVELKNPVPAK